MQCAELCRALQRGRGCGSDLSSAELRSVDLKKVRRSAEQIFNVEGIWFCLEPGLSCFAAQLATWWSFEVEVGAAG
jgi:hypothetical protein